jgi:phage tail protein X
VKTYITVQDDWWDTIAMRVYGFKRGNEHLMYVLLNANPTLINFASFSAGVAVNVPDVSTITDVQIPLVPWRNSTISPA